MLQVPGIHPGTAFLSFRERLENGSKGFRLDLREKREGENAAVLAFPLLCRYNDSSSKDELFLQPFIDFSEQDHPAAPSTDHPGPGQHAVH